MQAVQNCIKKGRGTMPDSQQILLSEGMQKKNLTLILICIALAVLTVIAYWPVKDYGFVNFDDIVYVYKNEYVQSGLSWNSIRWAFSVESMQGTSNWHPLTWLSLMFDYQLFGLNPHGYHLTNLLFHIINSILLFYVLHRMTKTLWQSLFVATLFALHPLHVESVAWIAERKDVLSTLFWMLTMGAYLFYVERPGLLRYLAVIVFFALGLMAKPMLVTLPFVLLLIDFWPLKRFEQMKTALAWIRPLLWEKVPLLVLTVLSCIVTYMAQQQGGAIISIDKLPIFDRVANAVISYSVYIAKMLWPSDLAVFYPHPGPWPLWQTLGAVLIVITVTLTVMWEAKRLPYLAMGWLWYAGTLVPVIGIVQVGQQAMAMADRYTYIPLIGLFIMAAWGIPELLKKLHYRKEVLLALSMLSLLCLLIVTRTQVGYWQDSITLFDHTLKVTEDNVLAYVNRGIALAGVGNYRQAIGDCDRAIEIKPNSAEAYYSRGVAYIGIGNYRQAISDCDRAIEIKPNYAEAYNNRGVAYAKIGNYKQAISDFDRAIEIKPNYEVACNNRGAAYNKLGKP
jgi:tetratricopeptide (TPR) repeat protein